MMTDDMSLVLFGAIIGVFATIISSVVAALINYVFEKRKSRKELSEKLFYLSGKFTQMHPTGDKTDFSENIQEYFALTNKAISDNNNNAISMLIGYTEATITEINQLLEEKKELKTEYEILQKQWRDYLKGVTKKES